jgi:hypothetical protein
MVNIPIAEVVEFGLSPEDRVVVVGQALDGAGAPVELASPLPPASGIDAAPSKGSGTKGGTETNLGSPGAASAD